jgi:hypothetical protein
MVTSVTVKVGDTSGRPVKVISGGDEVYVGGSESKTVEIGEGDELRIVPTDAPVPVENVVDVNDPNFRGPNGIQTAIIGPKLPKASGELEDIEEDGRYVQREVEEDTGLATQGGGPESRKGETPGPKVGASGTGKLFKEASVNRDEDERRKEAGLEEADKKQAEAEAKKKQDWEKEHPQGGPPGQEKKPQPK